MADGWERVVSLPGLEADELQVWRIDLVETAERYRKYLSVEELERADRLQAGQVRVQFVVGRACLRVLLGNLLGMLPASVPITLSTYGKPETRDADGKPLYFNIAHSRETVLIAICREGPVGLDLEYYDRETDVLAVARASFAQEECRQIEAVSNPDQQRRAFFRCWTRKEAVVKSDGRGLSLPLSSFEVPVLAEAEAALVRVAEAADEYAEWYVGDLALGDEIAGAFAVALPGLRPHTLVFPLRAAFETGLES